MAKMTQKCGFSLISLHMPLGFDLLSNAVTFIHQHILALPIHFCVPDLLHTGHQPICVVWADVGIVMDHSSVLKATLQSVLVWPAPLSHGRAKQGHTKHNCTPSHFALIQRASILSPVGLLSQEHKDFSAWFTVCEQL